MRMLLAARVTTATKLLLLLLLATGAQRAMIRTTFTPALIGRC